MKNFVGGWFSLPFESKSNGTCLKCLVYQSWKPFWLATQLYPCRRRLAGAAASTDMSSLLSSCMCVRKKCAWQVQHMSMHMDTKAKIKPKRIIQEQQNKCCRNRLRILSQKYRSRGDAPFKRQGTGDNRDVHMRYPWGTAPAAEGEYSRLQLRWFFRASENRSRSTLRWEYHVPTLSSRGRSRADNGSDPW